MSFSDIDLVIGNLDSDLAKNTSTSIREYILPSMSIGNISIHPADSLHELDNRTSRRLLTAEFLISKYRKVKQGDMTLDYLRAKIGLLFLTKHKGERYGEVSKRLQNEVVKHAVDVKLGTRERFDEELFFEILRLSRCPIAREFYLNCVEKAPSADYVKCWLRVFKSSRSANAWFKDYVEKRLLEALAG